MDKFLQQAVLAAASTDNKVAVCPVFTGLQALNDKWDALGLPKIAPL